MITDTHSMEYQYSLEREDCYKNSKFPTIRS